MTAAIVVAALVGVLAARPLLARGASVGAASLEAFERRWLPRAVAAALVLTAVGIAGVYTPMFLIGALLAGASFALVSALPAASPERARGAAVPLILGGVLLAWGAFAHPGPRWTIGECLGMVLGSSPLIPVLAFALLVVRRQGRVSWAAAAPAAVLALALVLAEDVLASPAVVRIGPRPEVVLLPLSFALVGAVWLCGECAAVRRGFAGRLAGGTCLAVLAAEALLVVTPTCPPSLAWWVGAERTRSLIGAQLEAPEREVRLRGLFLAAGTRVWARRPLGLGCGAPPLQPPPLEPDALPINPLLLFLRDADPEARIGASVVLGVVGATSAIPELAAALGDTDPRARRAAANALQQICMGEQHVNRPVDAGAFPSRAAGATIRRLTARLRDPDPRVGYAAYETLSYLCLTGSGRPPRRNPRLPALCAALEADPPAADQRILRVLLYSGDRRALPALQAVAERGDPPVRQDARNAVAALQGGRSWVATP